MKVIFHVVVSTFHANFFFFFLFVQILRLVLVLLRELIFLMFSALHLFKVSQDGVLDRAAFKRYS